MWYLDNAATTFPKPDSVYRALEECARNTLGNPGRAGHALSLAAERTVARCRLLLCRLFGGEDPERFLFTLNGTDALNAAIKGVLAPGDHVVTGNLEHNSVLRPLARLEQEGIVQVGRITCDREGYYRVEAVAAALRSDTKLVALTHASNVLGTVQPIAEIGALCRRKGVLFLVDAAQSAGAWPIDVQADAIDLLAAPGHKSLYGPTGTGVLYVGPRARVRPWREGGTGGDSLEPLQPSELPAALEAGTPNVLGIAGLVAGVEYVLERGAPRIGAEQGALARHLDDRLASIPGLILHPGIEDALASPRPRLAITSFTLAGTLPGELAAILDSSFGIGTRAGLHCAPDAHRFLGTLPEGTVRVSPGTLGPAGGLEELVRALGAIAEEA